jgi:hypothetical protein
MLDMGWGGFALWFGAPATIAFAWALIVGATLGTAFVAALIAGVVVTLCALMFFDR